MEKTSSTTSREKNHDDDTDAPARLAGCPLAGRPDPCRRFDAGGMWRQRWGWNRRPGPGQEHGRSGPTPGARGEGWGGRDGMAAVVVPDSADQASAWILSHDALTLVKPTLHSDGNASGMSYALDESDATGQAQTGQVTARLAENPPQMALTGLNARAAANAAAGANAGVVAFDQSDAMSTPAVQTDAAGAWRASAGNGSRLIDWTVSNSGQLTGSHTSTGCTYDGSLLAMTSGNSFNAQFNQSCPGVGAGAAQTIAFSGIATVNPSKNRMTVVGTSADDAHAVAILFQK